LTLPSRSCTFDAGTEISAVPDEFVGGVNNPFQELVPDTRVRGPTVPTDFVMWELDSVGMDASSSLEVNVRVVVWPAVNVPDPDRVMEMLGTGVVESIVIEPVNRVDRLSDLSIPYA
jgi:hypothetical protein